MYRNLFLYTAQHSDSSYRVTLEIVSEIIDNFLE